MKNRYLATEFDTILDIVWDRTIRVSRGIEEGFELRWEIGLIAVLC
jgi:hypothetical protein